MQDPEQPAPEKPDLPDPETGPETERDTETGAQPDRRRIVSSRHLAEGEGWELSELEFGLIIAFNAFSRWTTRCMAAAGQADLSALEILVLHHVNHRDRDKRLSDICFLLNIEDSHTVTYALRKLVKAELVSSQKRGKEVFYRSSPTGMALCDRYRDIRRECLLDGGESNPMLLEGLFSDKQGRDLRVVAQRLRVLSGQYDQASRSAASL
ncbi:winged helix DNA-binding protein [Phaeobacter sp.]|uniref:winged helix DNA-binding protein n=1 Tax=Phaeobacter sp. TaxID=1902409 RepID=UPI0025DA6D73|nr:winged helix DNA-binding protein [Phaeobacter sp.]